MMPSGRHATAVVIATILMGFPAATVPQSAKDRAGRLLSTLKVGQWIRLEGTLRKGSPLLCTEVKTLTGDFVDDDWTLKGTVGGINAGKHQFTIAMIPVHITDNAEFESPGGKVRAFPDLRVGMVVEVDGTYMRDRTFLAKDVDDETNDTDRSSGHEDIELIGKVERVDLSRRRITAMGMVFQLTEKTQIKSAIQ